MKLKTVCLALLTILLCLFSGCKNKPDVGISQLRTDVLYASSDGYEVTVYPEEREIPLIADGYSAQKSPVLIIKISSLSEISGTFTVCVNVDGKEYSALPTERANKILRVEIPVETLPSKELAITLKGEKKIALIAKSIVPEGLSSYEKAIELAVNALGDKITYNGNKPNGEFMVRVLVENENAFWYVGYVTEKNTYSFLINAEGNKIIATREAENIKF